MFFGAEQEEVDEEMSKSEGLAELLDYESYYSHKHKSLKISCVAEYSSEERDLLWPDSKTLNPERNFIVVKKFEKSPCYGKIVLRLLFFK